MIARFVATSGLLGQDASEKFQPAMRFATTTGVKGAAIGDGDAGAVADEAGTGGFCFLANGSDAATTTGWHRDGSNRHL